MSSTYVAVDLETLSKLPNAAILSIGAAKFNPLTGEIMDTFEANICPDTAVAFGGHIEGNTVMWWLGQSQEARQCITDGHRLPIQLALVAFSEWLTASEELPDEDLVMFGNGSKFDLTILESAYRATGISLPWTFHNELCGRTLRALASLTGADVLKAPEGFSHEGTQHRALDDAMWLAGEISWTITACKDGAQWLPEIEGHAARTLFPNRHKAAVPGEPEPVHPIDDGRDEGGPAHEN